MAGEAWNGLLRLSLIFCPIRLQPAAKLAEHPLKMAGSPEGESIVDIKSFVPRKQVVQTCLDTAFYLHPEGQLSGDTLHALRVGMMRSERVAVGSIKIGNRELAMLIEPYEAGLLISTLHPEEERYPSEFTERAEDSVAPDMIEIVEDIIKRRAGDFA